MVDPNSFENVYRLRATGCGQGAHGPRVYRIEPWGQAVDLTGWKESGAASASDAKQADFQGSRESLQERKEVFVPDGTAAGMPTATGLTVEAADV